MTDRRADDAMREIWEQWFSFYNKHFRGRYRYIGSGPDGFLRDCPADFT